MIYRMSENELPTSRLSKAIVRQTYRYTHTDRRPRNYMPLSGWSKICMQQLCAQTVQMKCLTIYKILIVHAGHSPPTVNTHVGLKTKRNYAFATDVCCQRRNTRITK